MIFAKKRKPLKKVSVAKKATPKKIVTNKKKSTTKKVTPRKNTAIQTLCVREVKTGVWMTDQAIRKYAKSKSKPKERTKPVIKPGAIISGNDNIFNNYNKPNRRLIVNKNNRGYMNLSKIHSIKGKEDKVRSGKLIPLKGKYKCLPEPSAVSVYPIKKDVNGKRLKTNDKRFSSTGERITRNDRNRLVVGRKKYFDNMSRR